MGSGASTIIAEEAAKPLDACDIEEALVVQEVIRLRGLLRKLSEQNGGGLSTTAPACRLRIAHFNDVYSIKHLAKLKAVIDARREGHANFLARRSFVSARSLHCVSAFGASYSDECYAPTRLRSVATSSAPPSCPRWIRASTS